MHPITVYSFGYLHPMPEDVPPFDITLDLRRLLADPAHVLPEEKRDMTGLDREVRRFVVDTPGAVELFYDLLRMVTTMACLKPVTVAFGCAGGRHRSVAFAHRLANEIETVHGMSGSVHHLHVHLPRVIRQETDANR